MVYAKEYSLILNGNLKNTANLGFYGVASFKISSDICSCLRDIVRFLSSHIFFCTVIVFSEEVASKHATNLYIFGAYIFGAFGRYVKDNLWEGIDCDYVFILVPELLLAWKYASSCKSLGCTTFF